MISSIVDEIESFIQLNLKKLKGCKNTHLYSFKTTKLTLRKFQKNTVT